MNAYDDAAAVWVGRAYGLDPTRISGVTFAVAGSACETCGYDAPGLSFRYGDRHLTEDLPDGVTPGSFIYECVQILAESGEIP